MTDIKVSDLEELHRVGAIKLPLGAAEYAKAAIDINGAADYEGDSAFGGGLGTSSVLEPFQGLRNLFQDRVLVESRDAIVAAGEALCEIAMNYAEQDAANSAALEEQQREYETGRDADGNQIPEHKLPPDDVPEAPTSGDERTDPVDGPDNPEVRPDPEVPLDNTEDMDIPMIPGN